MGTRHQIAGFVSDMVRTASPPPPTHIHQAVYLRYMYNDVHDPRANAFNRTSERFGTLFSPFFHISRSNCECCLEYMCQEGEDQVAQLDLIVMYYATEAQCIQMPSSSLRSAFGVCCMPPSS